jgi:hypothetical protein
VDGEPPRDLLEAEQLIAECGKARTSNLWHPFVVRVGHNMQQLRIPGMVIRCSRRW